MTATRIVEPGLTVMFTRRTVARFYLLRPDRRTRQIFLYCLGVAAERHGILLHALVVMSTHYHLVATDVRGVYPDFLQELNRLLANCTKVARGWPHQVFDSSGTHVLDLLTPESIADKCGYTVANPVACGAVRYARDWPGFVTRPSDLGGRAFVVDRPDVLRCSPELDHPCSARVDHRLNAIRMATSGVIGDDGARTPASA